MNNENWFREVDFLGAAEGVLASNEVPLNKTPNSLETEIESCLGDMLFSLSAESRDFEEEERTDEQLEKAREECSMLAQQIAAAIEEKAKRFDGNYEVYPYTEDGDGEVLIIGFWLAYVLTPYDVYRELFPVNQEN